MKPTTTVQSGSISLAVYTWGVKTPGRPTVLLVHGYPDSASIWEDTAKILAADHFVIAYDVRGAGRSDAPKRIADFDMSYLVDDMRAVLDAVSPDEAVHLIGHDWGGIQGWEAATSEKLKGRLLSYTTASGPCLDHIGHWARARMKNLNPQNARMLARQALHSWYVYLFHLPLLAPTAWKKGLDRQWPKVLTLLEGISGHHNPTQRGDGAVGVNLYRANVFKRVLNPQIRRADIPVQLIVAKRDAFITESLFEDLPQWAPRLWRRDVDAGHWIQASRPEWVAKCVREFVQLVEKGIEAPDLNCIQDLRGPGAGSQAKAA